MSGFDWEAFKSSLTGEPSWETADDLSRMSMEAAGVSPSLVSERERALQAEVDALRAQVARLQPCARRDPAIRGEAMSYEAMMQARAVRDNGDLDEPHRAANDTPGSQPEACDTKSAKSITSASDETEAE